MMMCYHCARIPHLDDFADNALGTDVVPDKFAKITRARNDTMSSHESKIKNILQAEKIKQLSTMALVCRPAVAQQQCGGSEDEGAGPDDALLSGGY